MRKPTRKELIDHLYSEGEDITQLNEAAGSILMGLALALQMGVEDAFAELCISFIEEHTRKFQKNTTNPSL